MLGSGNLLELLLHHDDVSDSDSRKFKQNNRQQLLQSNKINYKRQKVHVK